MKAVILKQKLAAIFHGGYYWSLGLKRPGKLPMLLLRISRHTWTGS